MLYPSNFNMEDSKKMYEFLKEVNALIVPGSKSFNDYVKILYMDYMTRYSNNLGKIIIPNVYALANKIEAGNCQTIDIFFDENTEMSMCVSTMYICEFSGKLADEIKKVLLSQGYPVCSIESSNSPKFMGEVVEDSVITVKITLSSIFQLSMFGSDLK